MQARLLSLVIVVGCGPATPAAANTTPAPAASVDSPATAGAEDSGVAASPSGAEEGCVSSGGKVEEGRCCPVGDFPDTCSTGTCSCSPPTKVVVKLCRCPEGSCYDGKRCARK